MGLGWRRKQNLGARGGARSGLAVRSPGGDNDPSLEVEMTEAERRALLITRRPPGRFLGVSVRSAAGAICAAATIVGAAGFLLPASHASRSWPKAKADAPASVAGHEVSSAFVQLASAEPNAAAATLASRLRETRREQSPAPAPASERAAAPAAPQPAPKVASLPAPAPATPESAPPPAVAQAPSAPPGPAMDPAEADGLLKRGEAFVAQGDIASARLVLQRAANGGHARAALSLAATYDPAMLRRLQVYGVPGDAAKARAWYEKAHELGAPEAATRLEVLARAGE